jgi:hypothetical protein
MNVYKREECIKKTKINYTQINQPETISIKLKKDEPNNGVLRITVIDQTKTPLCERLIFKKPKR